MRKSAVLFCLILCVVTSSFAQSRQNFQVAESEVVDGYIIKRVWLDHFDVPNVVVNHLNYEPITSMPTGVTPSFPDSLDIRIGMELKRPFALVRVPVFAKEEGQLIRLKSFELSVMETTAGERQEIGSKMRNTAVQSPLATGNWHKISVDRRGVYKIDYEFIKSNLKVSGPIPSASIRLLGHGGTMLPEGNSEGYFQTLPENALRIFDGGDGSFGPGDYFLFYAPGPSSWKKDSLNQRFTFSKNLYEDKSYYFLSVDGSNGLRISSLPGAGNGNVTVTQFDDYQVYEEDLVSVSRIGKEWVGDEFSNQPGKSTSKTYEFITGSVVGPIKLNVKTVVTGLAAGSAFSIFANGRLVDQYAADATNDLRLARVRTTAVEVQPSGSTLSVRLDFQPSSDGRGYLDNIQLNMRKLLRVTANEQLAFRDWQSVAPGNIAKFQIQTDGTAVQVWDVTNPTQPVAIQGELQAGNFVFTQQSDRLREYIAFGNNFLSPEYLGPTPNQNLAGAGQVDYIIVTHPVFRDAAERLAAFHREKSRLKTVVTNVSDIYNEFSSGSQDIAAIRNYVKMFYDRAGNDTSKMPRYLLLFGDASYDYKDRVQGNTNFVPVFETKVSYYLDSASSSDDFYGMLDDNENIEDYSIPNTLDIGVGRLPVKTLAEANNVVDKILHYKSNASLGPWRLTNTYVADNEDNAGAHLNDTETMVATVDSLSPIYNDFKVYLDNMPFVSTPGGTRSPESNKAINDQVYRGTFMINYSGHGNTKTLAHERILTAEDFNTWKNIDKLPFMVTATCDFAEFNNPAEVSSGERLILKRDGGAIAMLTTTQAVYAGPNRDINRGFLSTQFTQDSRGDWYAFGDALRHGKNKTYETTPGWWVMGNFMKFTLLGDPALSPNFPEFFVHTESIKLMGKEEYTDSIGALGGYTISGKVTDVDGNILNDFDGVVYVTFYDKPRVVNLKTKNYGTDRSYKTQNNVIYKGKATVSKGKFSFSFVAPKDINYDFGKGKISYYAENGITDAAGMDTMVIVGGMASNPYLENDPPIVKPYMNDSLFLDGGITGSNSLLYVVLYDETGINVSGNSVGHDLIAILDEAVDKPFVLNDYYETEADDYRRGYVHFPITDLSEGVHTLRVRAWDVNNNSGEGTVTFLVYEGNVMKVEKLMNYPNPFSDKTHFVFEHNHPDEPLKATILIYNIAGAQVARLEKQFTPGGSRTNEITWDGRGSNGAKLPAGMYVYKLNISTAIGISATAYEKLILLR